MQLLTTTAVQSSSVSFWLALQFLEAFLAEEGCTSTYWEIL